jgi:glutathione S-transferase
MNGPPLTLFVDAFFSSPYDFRCAVALEEKGLEYAFARVMMNEGQGLEPAYKERSLTARVPGLAHGDFWLSESMAIVEYLEDCFPPPVWTRLLPVDLQRRARVRQVLSFLGHDLPALVRERPSVTITYPALPKPPLSAAAQAEADELVRLALHVAADERAAGWTIASADTTFALLRLVRGGATLLPELTAFVEANLARPSVRRYLEHERPPHPPQTGRRVTS